MKAQDRMMSKEDVENTMMVYHHVRKGGPKDKRIRRVELMGEHTPKPLSYIKVTQSQDISLISVTDITKDLEALVGTIGDAYRPITAGSTDEREFCIVGFYNPAHAQEATKIAGKQNGYITICGVSMAVELAKSWFVSLYPRPKTAPLTDYKRMCVLQDA